jgi:hypothetical protein
MDHVDSQLFANSGSIVQQYLNHSGVSLASCAKERRGGYGYAEESLSERFSIDESSFPQQEFDHVSVPSVGGKMQWRISVLRPSVLQRRSALY